MQYLVQVTVGFITGIAIGILMVIVTGLICVGIDINKYYPGKLDGFMKDGIDNWTDWRIIYDTEGNETESKK